MKTYAKNIENRKDLVKRIEELTGLKSIYTYMPRCAYEIWTFVVEKDGVLTVQDDGDQSVIDALTAESMIGDEIVETDEPEQIDETDVPEQSASVTSADEWDDDEDGDEDETEEETAEAEDEWEGIEEDDGAPEPIEDPEAAPPATEDVWVDEPEETTEFPEPLTEEISFPLDQHTVQSLTNLICMVHSRGALLSKATSGEFFADKSLADAILDDKNFRSVHELIAYIREWEETNPELKGIRFGDNKVIFDGFGQAQDAETVQTFTKLAAAMNKMATTQKRVQAKEVDDSNEKYALRIWLIRLGLNGADSKADRKRLMEPLSGHTAFRNDEERERWEARQKAKRDAARAAAQNADPEQEGGEEA